MTGRSVNSDSISNPIERLLRKKGLLLSDLSYKLFKNMSISEIFVKGIGVALALLGLWLIWTSVAGLPASWIMSVAGLICIASGVYIVRGGNFTP
jgi:hypothetical protein